VKPINMTREWQIQARGWAAVAEERRDKIERALQVLRNAQTYDCHSGDALGGMRVCRHNAGDWVEAEVLSEVRKILESTP
jgi:hypothetical protein